MKQQGIQEEDERKLLVEVIDAYLQLNGMWAFLDDEATYKVMAARFKEDVAAEWQQSQEDDDEEDENQPTQGV